VEKRGRIALALKLPYRQHVRKAEGRNSYQKPADKKEDRMRRTALNITCLLTLLCRLGTADETNSTAAVQNTIRLVLPPVVYAVPGHEVNIYFDNIIFVPNIRNYVVDVECQHGRNDEARWRYTPEESHIGEFPLSIKVLDGMNNPVAEAATRVHVSPVNTGRGKTIALLIIGDSLTNGSRYPRELYRMLNTTNGPQTSLIGSHSGGGRAPADGIAHEGYGGWCWSTFCTRWRTEDLGDNNYRAKSKFLRLVDGKPQLDFQHYCDRYNKGKGPDYITVMLGINDVFSATDDTIARTIDNMFGFAETLLAEFRRVRPDTRIGLLLIPPPAASQDAFGSNYKCGQTRWQYRRNQHRVVERMIETFGNREAENIFLVPAYVNMDCVNNYIKRTEPVSSRNDKQIERDANGVHPTTPGYHQIADSIYFWLKHQLEL